jgi:type II secretory pathway pseudopilin PulG
MTRDAIDMSSRHETRNERGYVLLALLLMVALLSIASLKLIQDFKFQYQREQEEELIHRGVQYSRAVKRYYKKFGRYPTRIEELESTNNLRFLRRRYKDPVTGKDFKLLRLTDVQMSFNGVSPGVAVTDIASQQQGATAGSATSTPAAAGFAPSASASPQNQPTDAPSDVSQANATVANGASQTSPFQQPVAQQIGGNGIPQVFGGVAIVGVASVSKDKTIREFNKKDHYNQWQFIYDPSTDRGGLLTTPNQPPLLGATALTQQQNGMGVKPGMGTNPGLTNNPGLNGNPGMGGQMSTSPAPQNPGFNQQQ